MNNVLDKFMLKIDNIRFETIDDLYFRRVIIRELYNKLEYNERQVYKWYFFYQLCLLKNPLKKTAWEYINGENVEIEFATQYGEFLVKRNKVMLDNLKNCEAQN